MKLLTFILLLVTSQFALPTSTDPSSELLYKLIALNEKERASANNKVTLEYDETRTKTTNILNENIIPSLNEVYKDVENHINNLKQQTSAAGYDVSKCIASLREAQSSGELPNITEKAINDVNSIYGIIHFSTKSIAIHNIDVISKELESITTEYVKCTASEEPQYCNRTFPARLSAKELELPVLYNKEVDRTKLAFIQEVVNYENIGQDYVQQAIITTNPYLSLLESCVAVILALGN